MFLPESPRYLYGKKNYQEAIIVLTTMERINKPNALNRLNWELLKDDNKVEALQEKPPTVGSILSGEKTARDNLIIMIFVFSYGSFCFFLVPFYLASIEGADFFTLALASEIGELVACIICLFITRWMRLGRALIMFVAVSLAGSCLMLIFSYVSGGELNSTSNAVNGVLIMCTNIGVVCAFDIAYLINPELFPTIILSSVFGIVNVFSRGISILSPIVAKLPNPIPMYILVGISFFVLILSTRLKTNKLKE
jgi:hypothetical protein